LNELAKRILSATLLAALLLVVLWLGSWWFLALLAVGGVLVFREFARLVLAITPDVIWRALWLAVGVLYIGFALYGLWQVRAADRGLFYSVWLFLAVWSTDVGAFAAGRLIGGPKIAPAISPSKTWAGLVGGVILAGLVSAAMLAVLLGNWLTVGGAILFGFEIGAPLALLAQAGDFFESWMKRRAGVKDSGALIPGHGGLFDRIDGLLPVAIAFPFLLGIAG
jgi:phosphatidate cytidylyltransferase